jgi:hypothetical protein
MTIVALYLFSKSVYSHFLINHMTIIYHSTLIRSYMVPYIKSSYNTIFHNTYKRNLINFWNISYFRIL